MSDIQAVFERLNGLEAIIAKAGREGDTPLTPGARAMLGSLEARRDDLRAMATAMATERMIDVCDYRLLPAEPGTYPIKEVGHSLVRFQEMVTAFFDSIRSNRPKERVTPDRETEKASTLNFGYAYSGSLGVVLYVPNDQLLPAESDLDIAVSTIVSLSEADSLTEVKATAGRFGKGAVRSFYNWSKAHSDSGISVDLKWQRGDEVKVARCIQPADLKRIEGLIEIAEKREEEIVETGGILVALNVGGAGSFKLASPDKDVANVSGKFDPDFKWQTPHNVPARYRATLRKITFTSLWASDERVEWQLIDLRPDG
jgi:hypothetical protein